MIKKIRRFVVRLLLVPALLIAVIFGASLVSNKDAHGSVADFRQQIDIGTNNYRASQGLGHLTYDYTLEAFAQSWAEHLANNSEYYHNPNLATQVFADNSYRSVAENLVAQRENGTIALQAWVGSDGHRANLLGNYNRQGIGVAYGGKYDITYVQVLAFKDAPAPPPQPQPEPSAPTAPQQGTGTPSSEPAQPPTPSQGHTGNSEPASSEEQTEEDISTPRSLPIITPNPPFGFGDDGRDTLPTAKKNEEFVPSLLSQQDSEEKETGDALPDVFTVSSFIVPITAAGLFLLFVLMTAYLRRRGV